MGMLSRVVEKIRSRNAASEPPAPVALESHRGDLSLQEFIVPNTVELVGAYAFKGCENLRVVLFEPPSKVREIGYCAFAGCVALQTVELPDSLEKIGHSAFENCASLREMKIPHGVDCAGGGLFRGCERLEVLDDPKGLVLSFESRSWRDVAYDLRGTPILQRKVAEGSTVRLEEWIRARAVAQGEPVADGAFGEEGAIGGGLISRFLSIVDRARMELVAEHPDAQGWGTEEVVFHSFMSDSLVAYRRFRCLDTTESWDNSHFWLGEPDEGKVWQAAIQLLGRVMQWGVIPPYEGQIAFVGEPDRRNSPELPQMLDLARSLLPEPISLIFLRLDGIPAGTPTWEGTVVVRGEDVETGKRYSIVEKYNGWGGVDGSEDRYSRGLVADSR